MVHSICWTEINDWSKQLRYETDLQKKQAMIALPRMADENDLQKKHAMISLQRMADENDLQKKQAMI